MIEVIRSHKHVPGPVNQPNLPLESTVGELDINESPLKYRL